MARQFKTQDGLEIEALEDQDAPSQGASDEDSGTSPIDDKETVGDLQEAEPELRGGGAEYRPESPHALAKALPPAPNATTKTPELIDRLASSQAAPDEDSSQGGQGIPSGFDISKLMTTPDDLKKVMADKRNHAVLGGIIDNLSNRQSVGNFMLGRFAPKQSSAGLVQALDAQSELPIAEKQAQLAQVTKAPEIQYMQQAVNPNSALSKQIVASQKAALLMAASKVSDPDLKAQLEGTANSFEGQSGYNVTQFIKQTGLDKSFSTLGLGLGNLDWKVANAARQQGNADRNFGKKIDDQTNSATTGIDKDPLITRFQGQNAQIAIDKHTIQTSKIITPQMLHEISNGIASALNQGKAVGLGMADMQDMGTTMTSIASLEQKLLNRPEEGASPEIKQQVVDTLDRLGSAYGQAMGARAKQLQVGKNYANNPAANQAIDAKVQSYQPQETSGPLSQDSAKAPYGNVISQGGHMYQWNPNTRKYEAK